MEKFLGIVITFILVFYIIKFVIKLIMPFILKRFINKKMDGMFGQFDFNNGMNDDNYGQNSHEGDVTIKQTKQKTKKNSISDELGGEYVDFEDVK